MRVASAGTQVTVGPSDLRSQEDCLLQFRIKEGRKFYRFSSGKLGDIHCMIAIRVTSFLAKARQHTQLGV